MAEPNVDAALWTKLTDDAGVAALVVARVFYVQGPAKTPYPYVIFAPSGGGEENITPRRSKNMVYRVEAIAETKAAAVALDSAISTALHEQELTVAGWHNFVLDRGSEYRPPVENIEGKQVWRVGAFYRIRLACLTV